MDTRSAAWHYLLDKAWPLRTKLGLFLLVTGLALLGAYMLRTPALSEAGFHTLVILLLAAGLWISEAIPAFAVGLLVIGLELLLLSFRPNDPTPLAWEQFVNPWASPVVWLLLGGFCMATAAEQTRLDQRLSAFMVSFLGPKPGMFLLGILLTTAILSMFISNTATAALMMTVIGPFVARLGPHEPFRKALPLGIALSASVGGMGTIIGSPPNAIALGYVQSIGLDISFLDWMLFGVPLGLGLVVLVWAVLRWRYAGALQTLPGLPTEAEAAAARHFSLAQLIVMGTFTVTVGLWLTSAWHGVSVAAISFLPIVVFAVTGILKSEQIRLLPWDTLMLVAGGLSLGVAIRETGLADYLVGALPLDPSGQVAFTILLLGYVTVGLSNIMSNTAAATILIPLGGTLLPEHALPVAVVISLSASAAVLLPISTPPNAIAYATGWLRQKDFTLLGLVIGLLAPPLFVWTMQLLG
ncbi:solute carrier family 13 (sodium-dependent dicarboxylate transporter), member 2/3/5 [Catalinimonas alkaloidigena]|uniref:Solute carrier family 13 (Sodium-dependent dicarboxylate transporter), member 2/3/5 n=1 Tax=Catalinimonas alkaloidigena TaxID=1075417 RepID=A0A1G8WB73_9BACT|nr:DASS family sodium-coupled anion symporter [Catalinimonas alkaloidigena]SDJ75532.1 solute carrier family 13 (sodium-dependent dicarboxylate transporter), member 2/3/5 [Catalinimonas alkaloidigena]